MYFRETCGLLASILTAESSIPYAIGILTGNVKPNRATWIVLSIVNSLTLATIYCGGIRGSALFFPISYLVGSSTILLLSLRYGSSAWNRRDLYCLSSAFLIGICWQTFHCSAEVALALCLLVNLFGLYPTFIKAFRNPQTESRFAWNMSLAGSLTNLLVISHVSFMALAQPLFMLIANGILAYAVTTLPWLRRSKNKTHLSAPSVSATEAF